MRRMLILAGAVAALGMVTLLGVAFSQERTQPAADSPIEREKLSLAGWDPDEPVPAYAYYKKGNKAMPVVIFMHGLGGSKEQEGKRLRELAEKGFFVLAIDAHLHGERKVPGIFPQGKSLGNLGEDYSIWVHQSSVSHTARDVSKIIDALSARADVDASRIGVVGISMGSSTCMVLAWREPRISAVVGLIGAVDFWYDVTKTAPGPEQDAKRQALSPRVRQLVSAIDPRDRKAAIAPKALFLANGARDKGIDIQTIRTFVKEIRSRYEDHPDRLKFLEEPEVGHSVNDRMWNEGSQWLVRHLIEKPVAGEKVKPQAPEKPRKGPVNLNPPAVSTDPSVKLDYPIVYVRLPRKGFNGVPKSKFENPVWAQAGVPLQMHPGADLMLLHPNGREEVLVAGGKGSVTDPVVSFDGEWVYYSHFEDLTNWRHGFAPTSADIYKVHVATRKIVRLTRGGFSPNTGAAQWADDYRTPQPGKTTMPYPVCNMGPCPLPGGKVMFTSNRNGFISPRSTNNGHHIPLQLFVMDDDGSNVEMIGHLNIGAALHPVVLRDGRVMFSTLENQGQRDDLSWGLWSIHPDGTNWEPIVSSFLTTAFHFHTQLSGGDVVVAAYYGGIGTNGFSTYVKVPVERNAGNPRFGPAYGYDPRNPAMARLKRIPFSPLGLQQLTGFADDGDATALQMTKDGPWVGKVTHPSAAPDNHLLTVWNAHPLGDHDVDAGIYLIRSGKPIQEPGQMLLVKHDAKYDAQWPRPLVPYKRIHGINEPRYLKPLANDGTLSPHLPEGTPFGLVGTSSLYKRETFPDGKVAPGSVTATWPGEKTKPPYNMGWQNWRSQGADAGVYSNDDIHAIRILAMDPTTDRRNGPKPGRLFRSHAMERLRILGEIPVRKFGEPGASATGGQPTDPDGSPDTSFLAKIPADIAWTFQTLDRDGMVLNMAQTWHQVRPGEVRNNCGGCHAHSQKPTPFEKTAAAKPDYPVFDLTKQTPLLTSKTNDQSGKKWDSKDETGLRYDKTVKNVEYNRDVRPILERSCVACHTQKWDKPAGNLVLDDDRPEMHSDSHYPQTKLPNHYFRLAFDSKGKYGHKPLQSGPYGSRYVWPLQSRRSLLVWKVFGRRTDGFSNDDFPIETIPGDPTSVRLKGQPIADTPQNRSRVVQGYVGSVMPPPEAVAGTYTAPDGKKIKVAPLSDEDRRTLVRWIDLGCPIDLDYDPANSQQRGYGWMLDDNRPTLTLTHPKSGANGPLTRILVGMHDYDTGLDMSGFRVVADFALDGMAAGENLAPKFKAKTPGVWELTLARPLTELPNGKLTVSVKDRQGNTTRIERPFRVARE